MNAQRLYNQNADIYDLLDVLYFKNYETSPRKVVLEAIGDSDEVLDLCTGTATNGINIAKAKESAQVVGVDLSKDMLQIAENKAKQAGVTNLAAAILSEARRVLKDDGELIVTEGERSKSIGRKIKFLPIELFEPKPYKTFVEQDMQQYFKQHGFEMMQYHHCDYSRVMILTKI